MLELASLLPGDATLVAPRAPVILGPGAFTSFEMRTASGALVAEHDYPGMGHGISAAEAQDIGDFLGANAL